MFPVGRDDPTWRLTDQIAEPVFDPPPITDGRPGHHTSPTVDPAFAARSPAIALDRILIASSVARCAARLVDDARASTTFAATDADRKGQMMRVEVDGDKCQGHNRCYALAPTLFEFDDYGYASAVDDGHVASEHQDAARLAAANCPEYAITIHEDSP